MKQSQYHTIVSWSFLALQLCKFLAIFNVFLLLISAQCMNILFAFIGVLFIPNVSWCHFFLDFCNIIEWFYRLSLALSMPVAAASLTETVKVNILSHPFFFFLVLHVTRGFASLLPCKCQSQKFKFAFHIYQWYWTKELLTSTTDFMLNVVLFIDRHLISKWASERGRISNFLYPDHLSPSFSSKSFRLQVIISSYIPQSPLPYPILLHS